MNVATVSAALDRVVDPCSSAMGMPLGLLEMGLVTGVDVDDVAGTVEVTMRVTSPCCAYGETMADAARRTLEAMPGVRTATVRVDYGAMWTPLDIGTRATAQLDARRDANTRLSTLRPYDWTGRDPAPTPIATPPERGRT
jgi:metal-sulfur cluster biosynthetic enzyme